MNKNIVVINCTNDISSLEVAFLSSKHFLITCDYNKIRNVFLKLLMDHDIYSVTLIYREDEVFFEDAKKTDTIPYFYASKLDEAETLVDNLIKNPMKIVTQAINGNNVAVSFSQGFPS